MKRKAGVLIADEHDASDEAIGKLIEAQDDMELVGRVAEGEHLLKAVGESQPDVVLLDLTMAGTGLRSLEQLNQANPGVRTVVMANHEDISLLRTALATRSLGYVVYRGATVELLSVIRKVFRGRGYIEVPTGGLRIDPAWRELESPKRRELDAQLELLSKREKEVLRAVAYGYTNREIAERLGISVKSIETYRYRVAEKLAFRSRADLVRFALEVGLLQIGGEGLPQG